MTQAALGRAGHPQEAQRQATRPLGHSPVRAKLKAIKALEALEAQAAKPEKSQPEVGQARVHAIPAIHETPIQNIRNRLA